MHECIGKTLSVAVTKLPQKNDPFLSLDGSYAMICLLGSSC